MDNFKVGDMVRFDEKKLLDKIGHLPYWYVHCNFTIIELIDKFDSNGYRVVKLDKQFGAPSTDRITSQWLKSNIKFQRKLKLKKINGTNNE